jgi:CRISPR-associated Csx3 family protein
LVLCSHRSRLPLPEIPRGSLVIVEGRAPVVGQWPCICCTARQQRPRAADPRLGAVVVATHSQEWIVGQVVDVTLPAEK